LPEGMDSDMELKLRIWLESPPAGVDFALQKGRGHGYSCVQIQRSTGSDLCFEFTAEVNGPSFSGPFVQGPKGSQFVYIDIGTAAGQMNTPWSRRLKVPLNGIPSKLVEQATLETRVPGTGRDGGPNCATVKEFDGWRRVRE
jgi:hypothetical protein